MRSLPWDLQLQQEEVGCMSKGASSEGCRASNGAKRSLSWLREGQLELCG